MSNSSQVVTTENLANPHPITGTVGVSTVGGTVTVAGTVAASNLQNPHPVSGTVAVSNLANPMPVSGTVNAIAAVPATLASYVFSVANIAGVVAANNYLTIFNPVGSGKTIFLAGVFISCSATGASSVTDPMRGFRISAAPTGGTVQAASTVTKLSSASAATVADIRINNPTATALTPFFNSPAFTTSGNGTSPVHQVVTQPGVPFTLVAGEGVVLTTASGGTNQRWNISVSWGEL